MKLSDLGTDETKKTTKLSDLDSSVSTPKTTVGSIDPYSGQWIEGIGQKDVNKMLSESGKGVLSGMGQTATGIGELLPGEAGAASARATKALKDYGYGPSQVLGSLIAPSASITKAPILAGTLYGLAAPTGEEDTATRYLEKSLSGVLGGALGFAAKPLPSVEKTISQATSPSAVGEKIEKNLTERLKDLIKNRRQDFEEIKDSYLSAGSKSQDKILNDYKSLLQNTYAEGAAKGSPDEQALAEKLWKRISDRPTSLTEKEAGKVAPDFDAIEKERRFLNDVSNGLKIEGAEGITATFAKDMANKLESIIENNVPKEFNNFIKTYKTLSEPINQYNRAVGGAVIKRADEYLPELSKIDPANIPNKFFSSRRSINDLRSLSGDENFVNSIAKEHIATELRGKETAKEIKDYLSKNYDWLQELPSIRKDLDAIASLRSKSEIAKALAKWSTVAALASAGAKPITSAASKLYGIVSGD